MGISTVNFSCKVDYVRCQHPKHRTAAKMRSAHRAKAMVDHYVARPPEVCHLSHHRCVGIYKCALLPASCLCTCMGSKTVPAPFVAGVACRWQHAPVQAVIY